MRSPLTVVLTGDAGSLAVTRKCSDTTVSSTSPGGFASVTLSFYEPITSDFLVGYDTVTVYDGQTGEAVGQGRLTDPGKSSGSGGEVWQITAIGEGPASMSDTTAPRVYIETSLDAFYPRHLFSVSAGNEVADSPGGSADEAVVLSAPGGSVAANGVFAAMHYDRLVDTGQTLGGFAASRIGGKSDAGWNVVYTVSGDDGTPAAADMVDANLNAAAGGGTPDVVTTNFTAGADLVRFALKRDGGAITVVDDTTWVAIYDFYVAARRVLKDGTNAPSADHANAYVLASEVVGDLLGSGLLPRLDGDNAVIDTTTHHFDQLAWIDGITPGGILEELLAAESAFTWHAWERDASTGLHRFEWVAWPAAVRYSTTVADGFDSPAPESDVYDSVKVRYRNKRGRTKYATRTQTVDGIITPRQGFLDLGDETGSLANANRAGDRWLADRAAPPNSGTLRVARPVPDLVSGRLTKPWMIRPGNLIRVRGVRPHVDSLNAVDRDGTTVFRIVSSRWSDGDGAAVLELDAYSPTEARMIERLTNQRRRRN